MVARGLAIDLAVAAAKTIVASCKGYHVGISILDAAGTPKLYYIPDGTAGTHAYTGYRKAHTALAFNMPSGQVEAATKSDPALAAKYAADASNFVTWACAIEGLNKIKSRLK